MKITSATFVKGVTTKDNDIWDALPRVVMVGRSNVGKSSVINSLTGNKKLARSSSTAGRTQQINYFLINNSWYLVDLPGYGYARGSFETRKQITERINGYLFESNHPTSMILLVIDARTGMTESDISMYKDLVHHKKEFVVVVNKIDKVNLQEKHKSLSMIKNIVGDVPVLSYSAEKHSNKDSLLTLISSPL